MPPRIAIPLPTSTDPDYNRRAWPQYAEAITRSGGAPVEIPLTDSPATTARLIATCQGVLLPGSPADVNPQKYGQQPIDECNPADPARENVDELLLQDAHNLRKPILAICFGTQMLNVWRGGTLLQHLTPMPVNHAAGRAVAIAHTAVLAPNSLLAAIAAESETSNLQPATDNLQPSRLPINSSHHQAIAIPGDGLRVTARSPEDAVIEAIEPTPNLQPATDNLQLPFLIGVQWHPERTYSTDPASRALFTRFVAAAATWKPLAPTTP
ncbi:MAG: gamma-glutamyl-gamma-aminobutyrate hydrolase family protein [Acidobacteriaceae bacterium]|jgi:putative glutamine amidotransferase